MLPWSFPSRPWRVFHPWCAEATRHTTESQTCRNRQPSYVTSLWLHMIKDIRPRIHDDLTKETLRLAWLVLSEWIIIH